jgi:DNA-binding MarR family transcriptional regulator
MNLKLITEILSEIENFSNSESYSSNASVENFRQFLNQKAYEREKPENISSKNKLEVFELENEIAKQVILLGRYSKNLIRKSMENHHDLANEDFTYLFRMMDYKSLTKMQLIEKNAHEKQTGIEIIKRLVKNGLFVEFPDENDKRSVRISATEKGKQVFKNSMRDITIVSKIMCGKLSDKEKGNLLDYLKKLNIFHHTVYTNFKSETTDKILELV